MGYRRQAREYALQALYQLEVTQEAPDQVLHFFWAMHPAADEVKDFSSEIIRGVLEHRSEIDPLIEQYSSNWRLSRMTAIDRNVLRLAVYEILHGKDIPLNVTLNEAIEIAKQFGTEDSGAFINGILDKIAKESKKIA